MITLNLTNQEREAIELALIAAAKRDDKLAKKLGGQKNIDKRKHSASQHRLLADKISIAKEVTLQLGAQ